jgi:Holliday junction resolvase
MANKNKSKGTYHEKWFVEWLKKIGIKAKRQPLSGSLGGEYSGDIKLELLGHELVAEVKYRDASNFPSPFKVLDNRDLALYKRRRGSPQTLVIMSGETFESLMEKINEVPQHNDPEPSD